MGEARKTTLHAEPAWSIRPTAIEDDDFLDRLYVTTRIDEVRAWGWNDERAHAFLVAQARTQRRAYALQFPDAEHSILLGGVARAGRLIVSRDGELWSIVDIAVSPDYRRRGLASWAITTVQRRAEQMSSSSIRLCVEQQNPALRLYERLGFRPTERQSNQIFMEWRPC